MRRKLKLFFLATPTPTILQERVLINKQMKYLERNRLIDNGRIVEGKRKEGMEVRNKNGWATNK